MTRLELSVCTIQTDGLLYKQHSNKLKALYLRRIVVSAEEDIVVVEELFKLSNKWTDVSLKDIHFPRHRELLLDTLKTIVLMIAYSQGLQDTCN